MLPKKSDRYHPSSPMNKDLRIEAIRAQLEEVRVERLESSTRFVETEADLVRSIEVSRSKMHMMLKRGCDVRTYNRALQDSQSGSQSSFVPQQYIQQQAKLVQALHKAHIIKRQVNLIQSNSNTAVKFLLCEASVIENEQKQTEQDLMIQLSDLLNEKLAMEAAHHIRVRGQKTKIRILQQHVIPEGIEGGKNSDDSVGTSETFDDSVFMGYMYNESPVRNIVNSISRLLTMN